MEAKHIANLLLENINDYESNIKHLIIKALKEDGVLLDDYQKWFKYEKLARNSNDNT